LETTRGYVAIFEEELVRHYQAFLDRRRSLRPSEEYRPATDAEWREFQQHFDKRKVELGSCGRPYGTRCVHEHACVRCPMLHVSPTMIGRLDELEADLIARRGRAHREGWLGEIEGLDLTLSPTSTADSVKVGLSHLRGRRDQTRRLAQAIGLTELDGTHRAVESVKLAVAPVCAPPRAPRPSRGIKSRQREAQSQTAAVFFWPRESSLGDGTAVGGGDCCDPGSRLQEADPRADAQDR
jgi:hypothetical protein